jgi:hypothetical protein
MFQQIKNIDSAFRQMKRLSLMVVGGSFAFCGFVLYKSYELSGKVEDRIYVLAMQ